MDRGDRISYRVLAKGTPVESSDGATVGTVKRVMEVREKDVFDGVVIRTERGDRFVDAPEVAEIYEHAMILKIDAEAASQLPRPGENPAPTTIDNARSRASASRLSNSRACSTSSTAETTWAPCSSATSA